MFKKICGLGQILVVVLAFSGAGFAQIAGGGSTNQGAVGGGMGRSLSGQLGGILNKNVFAKAVKKNSTKPAVSKPKTPVTKPQATVAKNKTTPRPVPKTTAPDPVYADSGFDVLKYQPTANAGFDREFADLISQNPDEQAALLLIFAETKKAYDAEAKKLGRQNDLALVFTFFVSACLTVYHDAPEPTDEATEKLYQVIAQSLSESPEMAQMSDQEKSQNADRIVYISGLIYAGYLSAKQTNDAETLETYRQLAGTCLESLIGISAESIEFDKNGLKVRS